MLSILVIANVSGDSLACLLRLFKHATVNFRRHYGISVNRYASI